MLTNITITKQDTILVVAPHPDDECIGMGGCLCTYPEQCTVLVLTDGRAGHTEGTDDACVAKRQTEFVAEMQYLGIRRYQNLGVPDGTLMKHLNCLDEIDLSKYTKIFVTGNEDGHEDHTAACLCVLGAVEKQSCNAGVFSYEVHRELLHPTHYLNITECMEKKACAVRYHQSQLLSAPYDHYIVVNAECRALQQRQKDQFWEVYQLMLKQESSEDAGENEAERDLQKFRLFYRVLTNWMLKDGRDIASLLADRYHVVTCAIYGYAELGAILRKELQNSEVEVQYVMDKKITKDPEGKIPFYPPSVQLKKPDAVIVTAVYYFGEIQKELTELGFERVFSLHELVMEL